MTLKLAAFQHFCARFADAFLTSLSPLTYEHGDYSDGTEKLDPDYEPTACGRCGAFVELDADSSWCLDCLWSTSDPEAVVPPAASATPAGVCAPSEAPPAGPPIMSLDWIEPAVLDVLACHALSFNGDPETMWRWECADFCGVVHEHFPSRTEWREHVWDDLRDRLERASKPKK